MNNHPIKVVVAQLGARKHYQEPVLIYRWGMLSCLYTDFYLNNSLVSGILRHPLVAGRLPRIMKKILSRYHADLDGAPIVHYPFFALQYMVKRRHNLLAPARNYIWANKKFACEIIKHGGISDADLIYGFNSASLELFEYGKKRGIRCVLDQTIAASTLLNKLVQEEEGLWPNWSRITFTETEFDREISEREHMEQDMADAIVCGSSFVKNSLCMRGIKPFKISIVSLGRSMPDKLSHTRQITKHNELNILFLGAVGLRKGIPYLLMALRKLKGQIPFFCKAVGNIEIRNERVQEFSDICQFCGPVPRNEIHRYLDWADVMILPSICEGSAMAVYEALDYNVPVITTDNSGSVVRDGLDGYIVPIRSSEALVDKILAIHQCKKAGVTLTEMNSTRLHLHSQNKIAEQLFHDILASNSFPS